MKEMVLPQKPGNATQTSLDLLEIWKSISRSWKSLNKDVEKALSSTGLSLAELRILHTLHVDGPVPITKLATELLVTPAAITSLVDGLEGHELVERVRAEDDRRVVTIKITGKGEATLKRGMLLHKQYISKKFQALSAKEILLLAELLYRVAESNP